MPFNSYLFIFLVFPLSVIGYYLFNRTHKLQLGNLFLLAASLAFYYAAGWKFLLLLLVGVFVNYIFACAIHRIAWKKPLLVLAILCNISLLLYFKYWNFFITNINQIFNLEIGVQYILLPLGVSFYTFQQISYLVNVYKGILPQHTALEYAVYILYFPKLIMGPLIEPDVFLEQLQDLERRKPNFNNLSIALQMFALGLFKKVLLADTFAKAVNWGFANFEYATAGDWILITLFYTFQIYFDFSGYSDMAIAVSKAFNIDLPLNFNSPYKAYSLRDFWKRWHMSLTGFFTRYVYIPLGGNRKGEIRTYLNMFLVFLVSGFWHGANWTFILWGIMHGTICVLERLFDKKLQKLHSGFRWLVTFAIVNILWLLFRAESISQWASILRTIAGFQNTTISMGLLNAFALPEIDFIASIVPVISVLNQAMRGFGMNIFVLLAFCIVLIPENACKRTYRMNWITLIGTTILLIWSIISLAGESVFVYFGF